MADVAVAREQGSIGRRWLPVGAVLLAATIWGTIGTSLKLIDEHTEADAVEIAAIRAVGAAVALGWWLLLRDRSAFRLRRDDVPPLAAFGLVTVTVFYLVLVWTFERTSVAVGTLLLYLAPALVALGAALVLGEPLTRRKLLALGLAFVGCLLVVEAYRPTELDGSAAGIAFGLLSACCYGSYSLGGKALLSRFRPPTLLFYHYAFGAGGLILIKLATAPDHLPPPRDFILIAASVGVAVTLIPIALYTAGLRRLPAGEASILATWEPVMAIAVAAVVLGEVPSVGQVIGAAFVIAGVVMLAMSGRRWVRSGRTVSVSASGPLSPQPGPPSLRSSPRFNEGKGESGRLNGAGEGKAEWPGAEPSLWVGSQPRDPRANR